MFTLHNSRFTLIPGGEGSFWKGSGEEGEIGQSESGKSHSFSALKESVYLPAKKGKHIFILGKQTSHFPKKMMATIPV